MSVRSKGGIYDGLRQRKMTMDSMTNSTRQNGAQLSHDYLPTLANSASIHTSYTKHLIQ